MTVVEVPDYMVARGLLKNELVLENFTYTHVGSDVTCGQ